MWKSVTKSKVDIKYNMLALMITYLAKYAFIHLK